MTPEPKVRKLRVGVVGSGLIAQVMHLHYLTELDELFSIEAICDSSATVVASCADRYGVPRRYTRWEDLVEDDLDAVLILTSGSHAPIAVAAAGAGRHMFIEKPMCYSVAEGLEMARAASAAGITLMMGYPKRYDPGYRRARQLVSELEDLRFVRMTTLESPLGPYVSHYPLVRGADIDPSLIGSWEADRARRVTAAIGDQDELLRRTYESVLLDSMVHEFNLLRGILGEPTELKYASVRDTTVALVLDFDGLEAALAWVDLPGLADYQMEACFYDPGRRVRLAFPSPFLRSAPTVVEVDEGRTGEAASQLRREITSYEASFKLELIEFHRCVTTGASPETPVEDGLRDVALCQSVITAAASGRPVARPTDVSGS
jgi:predicted dehydrogenase